MICNIPHQKLTVILQNNSGNYLKVSKIVVQLEGASFYKINCQSLGKPLKHGFQTHLF